MSGVKGGTFYTLHCAVLQIISKKPKAFTVYLFSICTQQAISGKDNEIEYFTMHCFSYLTLLIEGIIYLKFSILLKGSFVCKYYN